MISAGEVKTYGIGPYKFTDVDGDGKLSNDDLVEVPGAPKTKTGVPQQIWASIFTLMAGNPKLIGTSYDALQKQAKKFLPDAKMVARLMNMPKNHDALMERAGVRRIDPPVSITIVSITIVGEGYETSDEFKISLRYEFVLPKNDIGAKRFLKAQGYRFIQSRGNPKELLAVSKDSIREAAREAISPWATDGEIEEYISKFKKYFVS